MPRSRQPPFVQEKYRKDLDFRLEAQYCAEKGIPYSWFIGGKNQWDEFSRTVAIVVHIENALACKHCGTRREEWDEKQGGERDAYYAETYVCPGCKEVEATEDALSKEAKQHGQRVLEGVKVRLVPKAEHLANLERNREANLERQKEQAADQIRRKEELEEKRRKRMEKRQAREMAEEPIRTPQELAEAEAALRAALGEDTD